MDSTGTSERYKGKNKKNKKKTKEAVQGKHLFSFSVLSAIHQAAFRV
jgi:hypothetical protein